MRQRVPSHRERCPSCQNSCLRPSSGNRCERSFASAHSTAQRRRARRRRSSDTARRRPRPEPLPRTSIRGSYARVFRYTARCDRPPRRAAWWASPGFSTCTRTIPSGSPSSHGWDSPCGSPPAPAKPSMKRAWRPYLRSPSATRASSCTDTLRGSSRTGCPSSSIPASRTARREDSEARNHFNCPIVTSYPEVMLNNVEGMRQGAVRYLESFPSPARSRSD